MSMHELTWLASRDLPRDQVVAWVLVSELDQMIEERGESLALLRVRRILARVCKTTKGLSILTLATSLFEKISRLQQEICALS